MHLSKAVPDAILPFAWIPTRGNDIPPHAVPLHGAADGQVYIARGVVEGQVQLGTTSYSSTAGARFQGIHGRSYYLLKYEVLTCGSSVRFQSQSPQYTIPEGDWIEVPKPVDLNPREKVQCQHLAQSRCFTLIDDSSSMRNLWPQVRAALAGVVDTLSSDNQWEGLDVRFLHHAEARSCVKTREEFECVFDSVATWEGEKVMTEKVTNVLEESITLISETASPRPVVLLIITNDVAVDHEELSEAMVFFCRRLDEKRIPKHMFRVHMLQMGDDRKAVKPLYGFRNRVIQQDRKRHMLNLVTFHRGRGVLNAETTIRLLLASTYIPVDEDPDIGERQPLEVIEVQYQSLERIRAMAER